VIPEDIMKTAESVYGNLGRGSRSDTDTIARALLAERERCYAMMEQQRIACENMTSAIRNA
jgi:hypothetical protein